MSLSPKERYLSTLAGETVDRRPVTPIFMAWAANYVGRTYRDYYLDADVLAESQLAMARDFGVDQVSSISDPWREADGYGNTLDYPAEGVGACKRHLFEDEVDPTLLERVDLVRTARCADRIRAVGLLARAVGDTHSVLGWVEGPLAEYVDLRDMESALIDLYDAPELYHEAARVIVRKALEFALPQVEGGADTIGVGDAAASLLSPALYEEFVLPHEAELVRGLHAMGARVKLHICGDTRQLVPLMARTGADIVDLDYPVDIATARAEVGPEQVFAGNFDPVRVLKNGTPETVRAAAERCLHAGGRRFILQPGCEVPPGTAPENVLAFTSGLR